MKKRFRKRSELIRAAIRNTRSWTPQERLCRNVLALNGIRNATLKDVRQVIRQQQMNEINRKYKELTDGRNKSRTLQT